MCRISRVFTQRKWNKISVSLEDNIQYLGIAVIPTHILVFFFSFLMLMLMYQTTGKKISIKVGEADVQKYLQSHMRLKVEMQEASNIGVFCVYVYINKYSIRLARFFPLQIERYFLREVVFDGKKNVFVAEIYVDSMCHQKGNLTGMSERYSTSNTLMLYTFFSVSKDRHILMSSNLFYLILCLK